MKKKRSKLYRILNKLKSSYISHFQAHNKLQYLGVVPFAVFFLIHILLDLGERTRIKKKWSLPIFLLLSIIMSGGFIE